MIEPSDLGPKLKPPRGGLLRLQQAVRQREVRRFHTRNWVAAGISACLVALSVLILSHGTIHQRQIDRAMQQALTAPPQTHFDNGAYFVLPSHGRNVRILLIGSLSPAQPLPATEMTSD